MIGRADCNKRMQGQEITASQSKELLYYISYGFVSLSFMILMEMVGV